MKPGHELDAKLAEKIGVDTKVHDPDGYSEGPCLKCGRESDWGYELQGPCIPLYSTSIATAIAAAEEMREQGRIKWWTINSPTDEDDYSNAQVGMLMDFTSLGSKHGPAHALTLALEAAL